MLGVPLLVIMNTTKVSVKNQQYEMEWLKDSFPHFFKLIKHMNQYITIAHIFFNLNSRFISEFNSILIVY